MNNIKRLFVMDKEKWQKIRKKGLKHYLFFTGFLKLSVLATLIILLQAYLNSIDYMFGEFSYQDFFQEYLIWWPLWFIISICFATYVYYSYERKFNSSVHESEELDT